MRFGAAGTGLNFQVAISAIHGAVKHALKFKMLNFFCVTIHFGSDGLGTRFITFLNGHREKLARVIEPRCQVFETADKVIECFLFFAYGLRMLRFVPEGRIFHFAVNFFEASLFVIDVKDTPEVQQGALKDLRRGFSWN